MLLALIAVLALGQQGSGPDNGGITRGNFLRIPDYRTPGTGVQTYFVDPTGADTNNCTTSGTSACLTIQGALNKAPKLLRDQVTVNVAAGSYAGFIISGFTTDTGVQQATGGLLINGALVNSTLATGSATGTATGAGQSAGAGSTFGVLCDSTATWTANDLRGRFVTTLNPANAALVVSSNTATCITIVGTWALPVAGSTTYAIQDPSVTITSPANLAAPAGAPAQPIAAGIIIDTGSMMYNQPAILVRNIRVANTTGSTGVLAGGDGSYTFTNLQIRPLSATAIGARLGLTGSTTSSARFQNCDTSIASSNGPVFVSSGSFTSRSSLWRNSGIATSGINIGAGATVSEGVAFATASLFSSEMLGLGQGSGCAVCVFNGRVTMQTGANRVSCGSSSAAGFAIRPLASVTTALATYASINSIASTDVSGCGVGLSVVGPGVADVTSMSGSATTTGFDVSLGGTVVYTKSGVTLTAGTEVNLDSGGATAAFIDIAAGACLATAPQSSRVCGR